MVHIFGESKLKRLSGRVFFLTLVGLFFWPHSNGEQQKDNPNLGVFSQSFDNGNAQCHFCYVSDDQFFPWTVGFAHELLKKIEDLAKSHVPLQRKDILKLVALLSSENQREAYTVLVFLGKFSYPYHFEYQQYTNDNITNLRQEINHALLVHMASSKVARQRFREYYLWMNEFGLGSEIHPPPFGESALSDVSLEKMLTAIKLSLNDVTFTENRDKQMWLLMLACVAANFVNDELFFSAIDEGGIVDKGVERILRQFVCRYERRKLNYFTFYWDNSVRCNWLAARIERAWSLLCVFFMVNDKGRAEIVWILTFDFSNAMWQLIEVPVWPRWTLHPRKTPFETWNIIDPEVVIDSDRSNIGVGRILDSEFVQESKLVICD